MRTLLVVCASLAMLTACGPNPAAGNNPGGSTSGGSTSGGATAGGSASVIATKQAYINFLNCAKTKMATAEQKSAIDLQISALAAVPDASWAAASASLTAAGQAWIQAYGATCAGN